MTREQAITEERNRYLKAIGRKAMHLAHIHLLTLSRLAGAGYANWNHAADRSV